MMTLVLEIAVPFVLFVLGLVFVSKIWKPLALKEKIASAHHFFHHVEKEHIAKGGTVDPHPPQPGKDEMRLGQRYMERLKRHNAAVFFIISDMPHVNPHEDDSKIPHFKEKVVEIWWDGGTEL